MGRVRFSDVVKRVNVFVDREHTDLLYYVGGEHIDSDAFMVRKNGLIKGATIGYKFHFGFQNMVNYKCDGCFAYRNCIAIADATLAGPPRGAVTRFVS